MRIVRFVVALILLAAGLCATAAPAMAWPPGQIGTAAINSTVFAPGGTVVVTVQNTKPGPLVMQILSTPVTIGTGTTGRDGTGSVSGAIPAGYSGAHTIQVTGNGGEIYPFQITVTSPTPTGTTCGGLASAGPTDPQIDRHTVIYRAARHCDGPPGTIVTASLSLGSWQAMREFVIGDSGTVGIGGAFTDAGHQLPLGASEAIVEVTLSDGSAPFDDGQRIVVITSQFGSVFCQPGGGAAVSWHGTGLVPGTEVTLSESGQTTIDIDTADASGNITLAGLAPTSGRAIDLQIIVFERVVDEYVTPVPFNCGTETPTNGLFQSLAPSRVLDTRTGNGAPRAKVGPGQSITVQLTGRGGLPADGVGSVVLNATVTNPTGAGYISVYPAGGDRPVVSSLNFTAGRSVPNAVTVPVGTDGKVNFYNGSGGTVDLVADVSGYFLAGTPTEPGAFASVAPTRILDTRTGTGAPRAKIGAGGTLALQVTGRGGLPTSGVASVVVNTTVTNPTGTGYVTAYPTGSTRPGVSSLNFVAGQTAPNAVTVPVGTGGKVNFYNGSGGSIDLLADISGYYLAGTPTEPGAFVSLTPARVLDTRTGTGAPRAVVARGAELTVQLTGRGGLPTTGVGSVVLNATVTNPTGNGYITVYPTGSTRPVVSSLNFVAKQTIPNAVTVPVNTNGKITLYNGSSGTVDLLADIAGYYLAAAAG